MISRYDARRIFINRNNKYNDFFTNRNVKHIKQYVTPNLSHPTASEILNLRTISHDWKIGDRFWKLAAKHYNGKAHLWWIIAWFNQTPTEGHIEIGDVVYIPLPLNKVLSYLRI